MPTQSAIRTAARIRDDFLEYFTELHRHIIVPSSPVVPQDDPTLLFTNAGMNQFKDVFLGTGSRPYARAVNSQKCIRAGGKHNDLEDVGKDTYHHTFFEMLGNWSFGDYFKQEAIAWAWELLTKVWGLDPTRLFVTVFRGDETDGLAPDEEAEAIWKQFVPAERISRWGKKDNFWEMGETGPCGPCSEIHYDSTPGKSGAALVNKGDPRVIEIWNLVFIQYNRSQNGTLTPLPAKHVDTGMGFERIVRVLQGKESNYDTDLWAPIFHRIENHTGAHPYRGRIDDPVDIAYRVIADHVRCLTMALTDGALPSNEGRGYVLRRILRRAARHAHQTLGVQGPLLCDLVPAVVDSLGEAFPELKRNPRKVAQIIRDEEESFLRTIDRGIELFEDAAAHDRTRILAEDAFKLHDTYGFPIDLTRVMAEERGMSVDVVGYENLMEEARRRSRQTVDAPHAMTLPPDAIAKLKHLGVKPTQDIDKFHARPITATVGAIWNGRDFDDIARTGAHVAIVLDRTNHYAEAGGQVGDRGKLQRGSEDMGAVSARGYSMRKGRSDFRFRIEDTQRFGDFILHIGRVVEGEIRVHDVLEVVVDHAHRNPVMANHTATHVLNHALRDVVGDEVEQKGSLVAHDRLRFDFTCAHAMSNEQIERVEAEINGVIQKDVPVYSDIIPLEQAKRIHGVRAVFGERYPDPVRVVSIGRPVAELLSNPDNPAWYAYSIEFCGGTHLASTGEADFCAIVQEQALAAGVRRMTALTGAAARAADLAGHELENRLGAAQSLDDESLPETVDQLAAGFEQLEIRLSTRHRAAPLLERLRTRVKAIRRGAQKEARGEVVSQARRIADNAASDVIVEILHGADKDTLLNAMDVIRSKCSGAAVMLFAPDEDEGKVAFASAVPQPLIASGRMAGDWVREAARICGGSGGGRPDMAQAGGKDPKKVNEAVAAARALASRAIV